MKTGVNIRIGESIRQYLESQGLQQQDVADRLGGISQSAVSAYYRGKPIGKNSARKWAEAFGFRENWLLTGEGSMLNTEQPKLVAEQIPSLSNVEILLRDMLAEKEAKIDTLQELIWELKEENGRLKEQLRAKGGDAQNAVDSSSAVA